MIGSHLVGRKGELDQIAAMLSRSAAAGETLLFFGEAGVGKSALLDAAAARATEANYRLVRVNGVEFEAEIGFSALSQAVLPLLDLAPRLVDLHRDTLLVALGMQEGPTPDRLVVATAALRLLQIAAETSPVLVIVDDLQWVDRASAEVFLFVARRVQGSALGFLAAARTNAGELLGQAGIDQRELLPLDDAAAEELLRARSPMLAPRVRHRLLQEAQGNPLALLELPPALTRRARASHHDLPDTLPLSRRLQSVFASRITTLPLATRDLLLLASLDGSGECEVLQTATGDPTLSQLGPAEETGLVTLSERDQRLAFRHPLTRSAVVALATPAEQREAHRRLGDALFAHPDRRAWHLGEAAISPDEEVAELLEQRARRALQRGDRGGVSWLFKAADLSPDPRQRWRRLSEAAWFGAFRAEHADALSRLLESLQTLEPGSEEALYTVASAMYFMLNNQSDITAAFRLGHDALQAVVPSVPLASAARTVLDLSAFLCVLAASPECTEGHRQLLRRLQPIVTEGSDLFAEALFDPAHTLLPVLDRIDAALSSIELHDDPNDVIRFSSIAIYADRLPRVRGALEKIETTEPGQVPVPLLMGAKIPLWLAAFEAGEWNTARELSRSGRKLVSEQGVLPSERQLDYLDGMLAALTGDTETVASMTDRLRESAELQNARMCLLYVHHVLLLAAAGQADFETAFRFASAISPPGELPQHTPVAIRTFFDLVDAAVHTGRVGDAGRHVAAVKRLRINEISPRLAMLVGASEAAITADRTVSSGLFERALRIEGAERWPFDVARVRLSYAEHLRRHRANEQARHQLDQARTIFAWLGAAPWVQRVDAQAQSLATRRARTAQEMSLGLTAKEYQVAELAARGLTNKQIGAELFLSPRTVGTYLYRAYPKLGITTRAALRDALSGWEDASSRQPRDPLAR